LTALGIDYQRDVAGTGIIAEIPGTGDGPCIALRADLDALPVIEETGLPFCSQVPGVMHACGHDGHTSMLLGAASLLALEPDLPAPVRLIFQPAEETGQGAKAMIEAGALDGVAMIFGGHVDRHYPVGSVCVTDGAVNASSDRFAIKITGRGGHAARPHETVDAVVVGSLMVMALQTIVSREVNPAHPSVVTVGRFDAGSASNVIASQALLEGSIRSQDQVVRLSLHQAIERMAKAIGQLHGAAVDVTIDLGTPVVSNPLQGTGVARQAAAMAVGEANIVKMETANMGGEDFGYYLEQVMGCYVRFGTARDGIEQHPAHSSKFDFDEEALAVGAAYYHAIAKVAGEQVAKGELPP
jgi:hippurate hydrolase